jgi:hypothetical protein
MRRDIEKLGGELRKLAISLVGRLATPMDDEQKRDYGTFMGGWRILSELKRPHTDAPTAEERDIEIEKLRKITQGMTFALGPWGGLLDEEVFTFAGVPYPKEFESRDQSAGSGYKGEQTDGRGA